MFSNLHSSLAPPKIRQSSSESPRGSTENLSTVGSSPAMADKKRRAPVTPNSYGVPGAHTGVSTQVEPASRGTYAPGGHLVTIREIENPGYVEADGSQNGKRPTIPLPDYESLFPQKRHGVQGHTRWDHIIAEVNQKQRDYAPDLVGQEMSVDGPEEHVASPRSSLPHGRPAIRHHQTPQEAKSKVCLDGTGERAPRPRSSLTQERSAIPLHLTPQEAKSKILLDGTGERAPSPRSSLTQERSAIPLHLTPQEARSKVCLDGQGERAPSPRSSLTQERSTIPLHLTPQEAKPVSSKKVAAPPPPKPVAATPPRSVAPSNVTKSQNIAQAQPSVDRPNPSAVPGSINTNTSSRDVPSVMSRDGVKKALLPPPAATDHKYMPPTEVPRTTSQAGLDTPSDDQKEVQVPMAKETPIAKPRQKVGSKEPVKQEGPDAPSVVVSAKNMNVHNQTKSNSDINNMDKHIMVANETFAEFDPFPSADLISEDPWAQLEQNQDVDDLFTGKEQKQQKLEDEKLEDKGMTADDLDQLFTLDNKTDPFSSFSASDSDKCPEQRKKEDSNQHTPAFQRKNSQRGRQNNKDTKPRQEPISKVEATTTKANEDIIPKEAVTESTTTARFPLQPHTEVKTQSYFNGGKRGGAQFKEDPFGTDPFNTPSSSCMSSILTTPEPVQIAMEESPYQAGGLSGGKPVLRAWVSPSDVQPVNAQSSNGGGVASTPRRPHPVKPLTSVENQHPTSSPAVREIKLYDSTAVKARAAASVESGPYTQLTQEELITLVVKQQTELSKKDLKIVELEEYIDNLLVRVIEEQPSILLSLNSKPV